MGAPDKTRTVPVKHMPFLMDDASIFRAAANTNYERNARKEERPSAASRPTIEQLLGFHSPVLVPLAEEVTGPFVAAVKGKSFGKDAATFLSRYGNDDYADHPLQKLKFSI